MVIYPGKDKPIKKPTASLHEIALFPVFQTREDYETLLRKPCPAPDPDRRAKYWFDPAYSDVTPDNDDYEAVTYRVPAINVLNGLPIADQDGRVKTTLITLWKWEAGSVNIPRGITNEFPSYANITKFAPVPVPIRELEPEEELLVVNGVLVVRNKVLYAEQRQKEAERNIVTLSERDWQRMEALLQKYLGR
jgi:hypothetical protein